MKILRYSSNGEAHYGIARDGGKFERLAGSPLENLEPSGHFDDETSVVVLAPFHRPRVFGLGYNYRAHSKEVGKPSPTLPVLFMKPSTTVIGPEEPIVYPADGENVHFEGELVVIIGKEARNVSEADALEYVLGYTCGNDVSDRVLQRRESEFGCLLVGKGYDTFAPIGPVVETELDPANLRLVTRVNGEVRQDGNTSALVYDVPALIAYLSKYMTLLPGDHIMTGTPAGVGPIKPGDVIEVEIEGIGVLRNHVVAA
ncbi:5-carboxymethyl-2-hydroxymuconate delta-isomerase [Caballeronia arvi]|uniref:5-carboxymethyl-2-hydroxymuconate delta-isomerase n=1 Tax=Caballeronia arvi TaxID=1777135 RepID=A0A158J3B4_9BURK|nr:fumarylacetoacetate hydrolase family protein [Caballeronia arvi]SAL63245.1 5-carboxymethyl-2-hydroxymuconate delta-isomerase [Caballeronia arvi]